MDSNVLSIMTVLTKQMQEETKTVTVTNNGRRRQRKNASKCCWFSHTVSRSSAGAVSRALAAPRKII